MCKCVEHVRLVVVCISNGDGDWWYRKNLSYFSPLINGIQTRF